MKFIGRVEEIKLINNEILKNCQSNILIYGRRRIGKSYLINQVLNNYEGIKIYYQCKKIDIKNTLNELSNIIKKELGISYPLQFNDFDMLLSFLFEFSKKIVLCIDEYGYLNEALKGVDSIIQQKIDKYKNNSNLKLILLGSSLDIMKNLIEKENPLFGRFDVVINLKEQNYYESSLYYQSFSNEEKVMLYSVFGGEPYFNSKIDESKTALENVVDLMLKKDSIGELFVEEILRNEINKVSNSYDVLQVIALGSKKHDDIKNRAFVDTTASLSQILKKLIKIDVVEKITPINDENNKKKTLYNIKSNVVKFYYKYIYKNITARENLNPIIFYKIFIQEDFESKFIPSIFEKIVKQYLIKENKKEDVVNPFYQIGTYWYDDPYNKVNGQFDVVTKDKNGYIFYEVKYQNKSIDDNIVNEEIEQLRKIDIEYYNLGFVSKSGFDLCEKRDYILIDLKDIFRE